MQYDSICFSEQCRLDHRQLFWARSQEDQLHFDQNHSVQAIHYSCPFFRSLKTERIKFKQTLEKTRSQLRQQYLQSLELVKQIMKAKFLQFQAKIINIYQLENKQINLDLLQPHIRTDTPKTQLFLNLINQKKAHPQEDIKIYILNMPKSCINKYKQQLDSFFKPLLLKTTKFESNLQQKIDKPKTKDQQPDVDSIEKLPQSTSKNQVQGSQGHNLKIQSTKNVPTQPVKRKKQPRNKQTLTELAEAFINSQQQLKHKDLKEPLLSKLPKRKNFQSYIESLMNKVCLNIQHEVHKDLGFIKMSARDRARVWTDLKNYKTWKDKELAYIFAKCVLFFMNLDKQIAIRPYEIYVIYSEIMIKVIEKMSRKNTQLTYSAAPKDLNKEIIYLYLHYENFDKVKELLVARYPHQKNLPQSFSEVVKQILVYTYQLIKEKEGVYNDEFQEIMNKQIDFREQRWRPVVSKYLQYYLDNRLDMKQKIELRDIMIRQVELLNHNNEANKDTILRASNKAKEPEVVNLQSESCDLGHFWTNKTKEQRNNLFPKIIKTEQISSSEQECPSQNDEISN